MWGGGPALLVTDFHSVSLASLSVATHLLPLFIPFSSLFPSDPFLLPITSLCLSLALELVKEAIDKAGYTEKIVIGMDVAASEFYRDGKYDLDFKSPADPSRYISGDQLGALYQDFVRNYPGESEGCGG